MLAPPATIGLLMDDTTGIEARLLPRQVQAQLRRRAAYFKIVNQSVPEGAPPPRLRPGPRSARRSSPTWPGTNTPSEKYGGAPGGPPVNRASSPRASTATDLAKSEAATSTAPPSRPRASTATISPRSRPRRLRPRARLRLPRIPGDETYDRLGISTAYERGRFGFSLLKRLGFTAAEIEEANETIIGRMTVEGAPPARGALRRLRLPGQPRRPEGQALPRARCPRADDGGHPASPLRRHLQDGQPSQRGHRRGGAEDLRGGLAPRPEP